MSDSGGESAQDRVVSAWYRMYRRDGRAPTVRSLSREVGYMSTSTTMSHLRNAAERGRLVHLGRQVPSFAPTPEPSLSVSLPWEALALIEQYEPNAFAAYVSGYLIRKDEKKPASDFSETGQKGGAN